MTRDEVIESLDSIASKAATEGNTDLAARAKNRLAELTQPGD